jgi:hypothetical protein
VPSNAFALWNVSPAQNDYSVQNGTVAAAISTATDWQTNSGVIAEFTFTVQEGSGQQHSWPVTITQVELSSGFEPVSIAGAQVGYVGRDAVPPQFDSELIFADGGFSLGFATEMGLKYDIEVSEDLESWQVLTTIQGTGGVVTASDEQAERTGARFYRAVQKE